MEQLKSKIAELEQRVEELEEILDCVMELPYTWCCARNGDQDE